MRQLTGTSEQAIQDHPPGKHSHFPADTTQAARQPSAADFHLRSHFTLGNMASHTDAGPAVSVNYSQ